MVAEIWRVISYLKRVKPKKSILQNPVSFDDSVVTNFAEYSVTKKRN